MKPAEVIDHAYLKSQLCHFILTYGRCAANRDHLLKLIKKEQRNCYINDPEVEKKNAFPCMADFLTKSDLAFVRYQFDNCEPDWIKKRDAPENRNVQFSCNTNYSSGNRGGRRHGGSVTTEKGMEVYNKAMKFFVDLKKDPNYDTFQRFCNSRAKAYGILPRWETTVPKDDELADSDDEDNTPVVVPTFDIGDDDLCAGFAAV